MTPATRPRPPDRPRLAPLLLSVLLLALAHPFPSRADTQRLTYFENTDYQLDVYKIFGREPGHTIMMIGGIQGDEPGGYLTADLYVDLTLKRGNLIVIPRANFKTIMQNTRAINADMNRQFNKAARDNIYEERVVQVLQSLMRESQLLLNLHDGSGFYSPEAMNDEVSPKRWGQSIIIDAETHETEEKKIIPLRDIAEQAAAGANAEITEARHHFHVKNTRTGDPDSPHPEQRLSATFFAVTKVGIPAFGVETSKSIQPHSARLRYQSTVINEFFKLFDVVPDLPPVRFDPPRLEFMVIRVGQGRPVVARDRETIAVPPGSEIEVEHVQSNYERGLSADVVGLGGDNDMHRPIVIDHATSVVARKDSLPCGEVRIEVAAERSEPTEGISLRVRHGERDQWLRPNAVLDVPLGETLTLLELASGKEGPFKVNLLGFVPPDQRRENLGHDLAYAVNTATDLLPRWSVDRRGETYKISATQAGREAAAWFLHLTRPRLERLLVLADGQRTWLEPGETLEVERSQTLEIVAAETTPPAGDVRINFKGYANASGRDDRGIPIRAEDLLAEHAMDREGRRWLITVSVGRARAGEVYVLYRP
ncbi:MAG: succinylglutamate desuccinylase/aspartoacylase family protein [Nitrospirae bacterium]|nr:succinylglutamate desuccinylase/aspartoacylase family protein [Nitrospirota bacterium]